MKKIFFLILCAVTIICFGKISKAQFPEDNPLIGKKAPSIELKDISGKKFSLSSLKGKVVLLQFWASQCPPCIRDLPSLDKIYQTYKNKKFVVVAVSTDSDQEVVKKIVHEQKISLPVVVDSQREVMNQYGVFALPTSFLINKKGHIVEQYIGEKDWMSQKSTDTINKILEVK